MTLVTLRMQLAAEAGTPDAAVRITNFDGSASSMKVYWQHAWYGRDGDSLYPLAGGLANAGHVRTPTGDPAANTYTWAVNALGIKAASRFQLPLLNTASGEDAAGMGWRSSVDAGDYELVDGEMYTEKSMASVLGRAKDEWYQFVQPERVERDPGSMTWDGTRAKNLVFVDAGNYTVTLSTTLTDVPRGSIVRVFKPKATLGSITVQVGSSTLATIGALHMGEFLFWIDDSVIPAVAHWMTVQESLSTSTLPAV